MQRRLAAEINQPAGSGPSPAPAVAPPTKSAEAQGQHRFKLSQGGPSRGPDNWQGLGLPAGHDGRNWAGNPGRFTARDNELHMHPTAQRVLHRWWPQKNWQSEALIVQRPQPREGGRKSAEGKVWSPRRGWVWPTEKAAGQRRAHGTWAWPSSWTKGRPRDQDHEQQRPLPPAERERAAPAEPPPHEIIHTSSELEWSAHHSSGRPTSRAAPRCQQGTPCARSRAPARSSQTGERSGRTRRRSMRGARRPPAAASVAHRGYYAGRRGRGGRDATHAAHAAHAATIALCSPRGDRPRVAASLVVRFVGASGRQHRIGGGSARLPRRQLDRRGQAAKHGVGRFSEPPAAASLLLVRSALFGASPAGAGVSRVVSHRLPQSEGEERRRARAVVRRQHGSGARLVLLTRYLRARARAIVEWLSVRCVTCVVGVVASWAGQSLRRASAQNDAAAADLASASPLLTARSATRDLV